MSPITRAQVEALPHYTEDGDVCRDPSCTGGKGALLGREEVLALLAASPSSAGEQTPERLSKEGEKLIWEALDAAYGAGINKGAGYVHEKENALRGYVLELEGRSSSLYRRPTPSSEEGNT